MKIKNVVLVLAVVMFSYVVSAQKVEVDTKVSTVHWLGKKIGGEHDGYIKLKSGQLVMKGDKIVSGSFIMDMNSITNTDIEDAEYSQKLVGHLKSDDFFGVASYPTAKFIITKSTKFKNGKATVFGELTIKNKTESISFDVEKSASAYVAKIDVDRAKFDVRYGSDSFFDNLGDKVIDDIFTLTLNLVTD
ncbi:YceI family protein [Carboxylicivirga sp. N1Y90]|uniref:YceI family protein n=1 Tax=Carboxylicivirga fragile TaxID=3417571 RepID=UPI003D347E96|nr:YceI family protein [Marinilabiliaceae bacterium N1Y90]